MIARALRRAFAPRPVLSTRRIVALATLVAAGAVEPCGMAVDPGRHRRYPRTRPLLIGERR